MTELEKLIEERKKLNAKIQALRLEARTIVKAGAAYVESKEYPTGRVDWRLRIRSAQDPGFPNEPGRLTSVILSSSCCDSSPENAIARLREIEESIADILREWSV